MIEDTVPEQDHVIRYVKPSLVHDNKVNGGAFTLRKDEEGLSVNWLEAFGNDDQTDSVNEIRNLCRISLASTGKFAKLNLITTNYK